MKENVSEINIFSNTFWGKERMEMNWKINIFFKKINIDCSYIYARVCINLI